MFEENWDELRCSRTAVPPHLHNLTQVLRLNMLFSSIWKTTVPRTRSASFSAAETLVLRNPNRPALLRKQSSLSPTWRLFSWRLLFCCLSVFPGLKHKKLKQSCCSAPPSAARLRPTLLPKNNPIPIPREGKTPGQSKAAVV